MLSHEIYLLVSCSLITIGAAIRVDWNTNKGPIIPATPRTTIRPLPPYREPAPVWEDQSNDIPNPNPYVYVLPPPSRPRPATNNYLTFDRRPVTQTNYDNNNYGNIIAPHQVNSYLQNGNSNVVAALSPKYVPNVGFKYAAIVPGNRNGNGNNNGNGNGNGIKATNGGEGYYFGTGDKLQGRYNAKTKKYKAYEKVKYVPLNYQPRLEYALPDVQAYIPVFDQDALVRTQQLPYLQAAQSYNMQPVIAVESLRSTNTNATGIANATATSTSTSTSTSIAYVADNLPSAVTQQPFRPIHTKLNTARTFDEQSKSKQTASSLNGIF